MFAQVRKSALYGKAHSGGRPSRKGALCVRYATERRILAAGPHGKAHSAIVVGYRMRLFVRRWV